MKTVLQDTSRPRVLVSRCITFDHCRWDGTIIASPFVETMKPRRNSPVNVLMHALGYFTQTVTPDERHFFLDLLEQYRNKKIPLSACNAAITAWIIRFDEPYLQRQYFFAPYPRELINLVDRARQAS
jgi:uncharacterized protein YbgA (DUF1722 family)